MTAITLPGSINKACRYLDNERNHKQALNRFLKSKTFANTIFNHKKKHPETPVGEYRYTLEILLTHYCAGQSINLNDLIDDAHQKLAALGEKRSLSRTALRDSFVPLLVELGIITGNKPMLWAYLDTPPLTRKFLGHAQNWWRANLAKTEAESRLAQEIRNQKALHRLEKTVLENRAAQDDIRHHLDYIKKEDEKCREIAYNLGIPYSKAKEEMMKKRSKTGEAVHLKNRIFLILVAGTLLTGFLISSDDNTRDAPNWSQNAAYAAATEHVETNGLSVGETIWRERYIELYKRHGGATPEMEQEMIRLSGEYMISMKKMREIVAGISTEEVAP